MSALSLQVWNALRRPPIHHPLFRRVSHSHPPVAQRHLTSIQRAVLTVLFVGGVYVGLRYYAQAIIVGTLLIPLGVAALYMALHGTLAGLFWAIRVSGAIAQERERGIYDLLSTSPYGAFGVSWAICTGCQYHDQTFNGIGAQRVWFSRIFFISLLLFGGVIVQIDPRSFDGRPLVGLLLIVEIAAALALVFHIDDIQSTVIGSLVGLIVPLFARNRLDARVGAFVGFLLLQIGAYVLIGLIGFVLLPQLSNILTFDATIKLLLLPFEQVLVFFAVRELIARGLWRLNVLLLDGDVSDPSLLSKGGRLVC